MAFSFERHAHSPAAGKCRTATLNGSIGVLFQGVPQFDFLGRASAPVIVGTIVLQVGRCEGCSCVGLSAVNRLRRVSKNIATGNSFQTDY
jgi:hypothetical protein